MSKRTKTLHHGGTEDTEKKKSTPCFLCLRGEFFSFCQEFGS